jgi:hypothetical protein
VGVCGIDDLMDWDRPIEPKQGPAASASFCWDVNSSIWSSVVLTLSLSVPRKRSPRGRPPSHSVSTLISLSILLLSTFLLIHHF